MTSAMAQAGNVSPSRSPRLPSPPPFPEVQIPPKSPTPGAKSDVAAQDAEEAAILKNAATRRIRPGTKSSDMASGPPLVPLADLDSSFQLQEHLKALYFHATKSEDNNTTIPITRETALLIATPPENVDRSLWLYELCRFLVQKANNLIIGFFSDNPPCSAQNCPEMRASEWQYLCAVHDPPKSCCAIDYCCHTLDWAANILTSQKHFPSRLSLGGDTGGSQQSVRQLTNIFRRVYRMFAHAWFQHREVFWTLENQEGLYIFYKTVCDVYSLIQAESYTVPPEAEGITQADEHSREEPAPPTGFGFGTAHGKIPEPGKEDAIATQPEDGDTNTVLSTGATTRRHKHTPSTGSFVTTIAEGDEEIEDKKESLPPLDTVEPNRATFQSTSSPSKLATTVVEAKPAEKKEEEEEEEEEEKVKKSEDVVFAPGWVPQIKDLDLKEKEGPLNDLAEDPVQEAVKEEGNDAPHEQPQDKSEPEMDDIALKKD